MFSFMKSIIDSCLKMDKEIVEIWLPVDVYMKLESQLITPFGGREIKLETIFGIKVRCSYKNPIKLIFKDED